MCGSASPEDTCVKLIISGNMGASTLLLSRREHVHPSMHSCIQTDAQRDSQPASQTRMHACKHEYMATCKDACVPACMIMHAYMANTHIHICKRAGMSKHEHYIHGPHYIHLHTYVYILTLALELCLCTYIFSTRNIHTYRQTDRQTDRLTYVLTFLREYLVPVAYIHQ